MHVDGDSDSDGTDEHILDTRTSKAGRRGIGGDGLMCVRMIAEHTHTYTHRHIAQICAY